MSYGLSGQLERVITTTQDGAGQTTDRKQVEYRYDPQGIRFIASDYAYNNQTSNFILATSTEYLIDHSNFTGYQQTIIETTKNAAGQTTKRISYTYGLDEISQTTTEIDPVSQLATRSSQITFAHDGHGSTRVLFEAAAVIAQIYTYSAYGELIALHNSLGSNLTAQASPLTSVLYNGESLDPTTGLYNFRARWYSTGNGRFERLDPFAGNPNDPFSFNKYGFVHGDPVHGIDPTGEFLVSMMVSFGISSQLRKMDAQKNFGAFRTFLRFAHPLVKYALSIYESLAFWPSIGNNVYEGIVRSSVTGAGGADVTTALLSSTDKISQWWLTKLSADDSDTLTTFDLFGIFDQQSMYSFSGWDIAPFNSDIEGQRSAFAGGNANWAPRSVTVSGKVYYAHEVNYFIWGAAHALAKKKGTEHSGSLTKDSMTRWVLAYRFHTDFAYITKPNDGTMFGRAAWAEAGWDYVETGVFTPPVNFQLPKATPNATQTFSAANMSVQLGKHYPN